MVMPSCYPLIDSDENFIYSPSVYEDTMHILSGYNITIDSTTGDLFTMLSQVKFESNYLEKIPRVIIEVITLE